jgi:hypothetical protein
MVKNSPKADVRGDVRGNMACADTPPRSALASSLLNLLTRCDAEGRPDRPKRAIAIGWPGTLRMGARIEETVLSDSATNGPINFW